MDVNSDISSNNWNNDGDDNDTTTDWNWLIQLGSRNSSL